MDMAEGSETATVIYFDLLTGDVRKSEVNWQVFSWSYKGSLSRWYVLIQVSNCTVSISMLFACLVVDSALLCCTYSSKKQLCTIINLC